MSIYTQSGSGAPAVIIVPGLGGSGPEHWQTLWEQRRLDTVRADLGMWNSPHRNTWVTKLDQTIRAVRRPVVLVAHSLGCLAVAWWATLSPQPYGWPVAGALLVAPADVDRADAPSELHGFAPSPRTVLPFPSIVVSSSDDSWTMPEATRNLAAAWGSHLVEIGACGHVNAASGIGAWPEGEELLERVMAANRNESGVIRYPSAARTMLSTAIESRLPLG